MQYHSSFIVSFCCSKAGRDSCVAEALFFTDWGHLLSVGVMQVRARVCARCRTMVGAWVSDCGRGVRCRTAVGASVSDRGRGVGVGP
jgi:hypothetical protein